MQLTPTGATLMLLLTTLIWGGGFMTAQAALDAGLDGTLILTVRFFLGAAVVFLAFMPRILKSRGKTVLHGLGAGALLFLGFYTQILGQGRTTIPNTAFFTSTNVLMVPFIVWAITKKRPEKRIFALCFITMLGMICLTLDDALRLSPTAGDFLVLLCAFFFAAHIVYLDIVCRNDDSVQVTFFQLLFCCLFSALALLLSSPEISPAALRASTLPLLYSGLLSSGACYLMQTRAQTVLPAAQAGIVLSTEGLFGTVLSLLFGWATFRYPIAVGGLLVTLAVILSSLPAKEKDRTDPAT